MENISAQLCGNMFIGDCVVSANILWTNAREPGRTARLDRETDSLPRTIVHGFSCALTPILSLQIAGMFRGEDGEYRIPAKSN